MKEKLKNPNVGTVLALLLLMVIVTIMNPSFIYPSNLINLFRQITINGCIALGMTFVILTGGIDLSVGSILALTSALFAGFLVGGMNVILAIIITLILGALMGLFNGLLITKGKLAPFIVTLATMTVYRGLTLVYMNGNPIQGQGNKFAFAFLGRGLVFGFPFQIILFVLLFAGCFVLLRKTSFGKKTYAVGGNEKACFIAGINTTKIKTMIYVLSGVLATIAGLVLTSRLNSAQPTAGQAYELDAIAAVVLGGTSMSGGKGTVVGTLIGAIILGVLNNGLNLLGISSFYQQIVKGIVILLAVLIDRQRDK